MNLDHDDIRIGFQLLNQASSRFKRTSNLRSHEGSAQNRKETDPGATAMEDQMVSARVGLRQVCRTTDELEVIDFTMEVHLIPYDRPR